jgi:hypothetical protein
MIEVQGVIKSSWLIGYLVFFTWMAVCDIYVAIGSFVVSIFFGDWYSFMISSDDWCTSTMSGI